MALDPSIILGFHPTVALADPLDQAAKALQIRGAQQTQAQQAAAFPGQQAAQQQQIQSGALENQQRQMDLDDQNKMRKAYQDANGDPDQMIINATKAGVGPKTLLATQQSLISMKEAKQKLTTAELENHNTKNDQLNALLQPVLAEQDPVKQAALWNQQQQTGLQQGVLSPQEVQAHPYPGSPDAVKGYIASLATDKWLTAEAAKDSAAARAQTANTGSVNAALEAPTKKAAADQALASEAAQKLRGATDGPSYAAIMDTLDPKIADRFVPPALFDPATTPQANDSRVLTPQQQTQAAQAQANATREAAHNAETEKTAGANLAVNQGRLNVEQQRYGFESGGGVSPQATAIAQGKLDPQTTRAMLRSNPGLISQVQKVDPNFDEANIENRFNTLKEFTSTSAGKAGGQALALNTLIHHADLYLQTAEALKNGSFVPGNAVYNAVASAFGSAPPTQANLVARFFAGETGKVATGGVPAEGEINGILKNLGNSASPDQIAGAGKTLLQIAAGRATPLMERAKQAKIDNQVQVLGPDAREILTRRGFDPNTVKPGTPAPQGPLPKGNGAPITDAILRQYYQANGGDKDKTRKAVTDAGWVIPKAF